MVTPGGNMKTRNERLTELRAEKARLTLMYRNCGSSVRQFRIQEDLDEVNDEIRMLLTPTHAHA